MFSNYLESLQIISASPFQAIGNIFHNCSLALTDFWHFIYFYVNSIVYPTDNIKNSIYFDDFKLKIFQLLLIVLLLNLLLVVIIWRLEGKNICKKLMNPTYKETEELKASVARLNLPKDYLPRF